MLYGHGQVVDRVDVPKNKEIWRFLLAVYFSHYGSRDIRNVKPLRPDIDTLILYAFGVRRIFQKAIRLMFVDIFTFYRDFVLQTAILLDVTVSAQMSKLTKS